MPQRREPDTSEHLHPATEKAYLAEASKYRAEARFATAEAKMAEIRLREEERLEALWDRPRYFFTKDVSGKSIRECIARLDEWDHNDPACDVEITFTSPGGDCISGFALWDYLMEYRRKGHHLTTHTLGMAASMAGVLLQAGDVRCMGAESFLLIHELASDWAVGKLGTIEDELDFLHKLQDRLWAVLAARSTLDADEVKARAQRRDWWLNATEALDLGFIDQII